MSAGRRFGAGTALVACALVLAVAGCTAEKTSSSDDGVTDGTPPGGPPDPIALSVSLPDTTVRLGDPLDFQVTLENTGDAPVTVNVPRIGRQSLVFRVAKGPRIQVVERLHADIDQRTGQLVWKANDVKTLAPGDTLEQTVRTHALEVGEFSYTPQYVRQGATVNTASPIKLTVQPADGGDDWIGVRIVSSVGDVTARLRPDLAYNTVESFVSLARKGFYDGLLFHRVVQQFMAQGGCPQGTGNGGPGYFLPLEAHTLLLHDRGVLSMARTGHPNTAGSQFFLMFRRNPGLDPGFQRQPGYTTFGQMVEGDATLDELEKLGAPPTAPMGQQQPKSPITIDRIEVVTLSSN